MSSSPEQLSAQKTQAFLNGQKVRTAPYLSFSVAASLGNGFLLIIQAWLLALIIDGALFKAQGLSDISRYLWALCAVIAARAMMVALSSRMAFKAAAQVRHDVRIKLHKHLQKLGPLAVTREGSGALVNMLGEGIDALEGYYARYLPAMALAGMMPLAVLVFVFPHDWLSALVMIVTAPLIPFFMILIGKGAEALNQKQWKKLARMSGYFLDVIQGLTTLKLFNASRREANHIAKIADEYRRDTMGVLRVAFLSSFMLEFLSTVSIAIVAVLIGFRLLSGDMDFLYGFFVLVLAPEFYLPLRNMGAAYHARMEAIGAAEKMTELMATPLPPAPENPKFINDDDPIRVEFKNVYASYEEGRPALNGVSFGVSSGESAALVGPSGAGKSTIMALLLGFILPDQGQILINDIDLNELDRTAWREKIGWVPQNPHLFYGSVRDNIKLGMPDAPDGAVQEAARLCRASDFIGTLPQTYNTLIGERGYGLSGGQVQRIALARALLRSAPLMLLDEPSAALDRETETALQDTFLKHTEEKTVLTIAHRLHTIQKADQIIVLDQGQVVQRGAHKTLSKDKGGLYERLLAQGEVLS